MHRPYVPVGLSGPSHSALTPLPHAEPQTLLTLPIQTQASPPRSLEAVGYDHLEKDQPLRQFEIALLPFRTFYPSTPAYAVSLDDSSSSIHPIFVIFRSGIAFDKDHRDAQADPSPPALIAGLTHPNYRRHPLDLSSAR